MIAAAAERQHGLVTARQLMQTAGLTRNAIRAREKRGALHRRYRGVYSVGHAALSREAELHAAVLAAGDGAALSHEAAAELLRIRRNRARAIDVVAPRRRVVPGVHVHRSARLDGRDVTSCDGVPVTNVARTLVDLSDRLIPEELTAVISEAAFRDRFDLVVTRRAMQRANGRRNLHVLDEALRLYAAGSAGTKSRAEVAGVKAIESSDLPKPLVNVKSADIETDFAWPDRKLIVEIDGPGHDRPIVQRDDARRTAALRAAGWTVLRFTTDEVEQRPERVVARLREYL